MSTLKVDTILKRTGTGTITVGQSGDTITIPSGATLNAAGSTSGLPDNTPAFLVYADASQTVSSATNTLVTLDNESYDTDNAFSSNRFTVPIGEAGKYFFHGQIDCHANAVSENSISNAHIYKNGSGIIESVVDFRNNYGRRVSVNVSVVLDLAVGDYIELYGNITDTSGSPTFYSTSGGFFTFLTGYKLIGV